MKLKLAAALAVFAVAGGAVAQAPSAPQPYLSKDAIDTYRLLPEAPVPGTTRWEADRTIFLQTRKLKDTPRWALAINDVDQRAVLRDLACAVGVELTPKNAPRTAAMVARMGPDVSWATNHPKDIYRRPRPYLTDDGPTCVEKSDALSKSPDYPSGHVTWGWTVGLVLAELVPDRATEILVRARAFGESRLVCGVHTMSAVEAGRTNASAVVAALHGAEAFRKDLDAARKEIAAARKVGPAPDPAACAREAELTAKAPY